MSSWVRGHLTESRKSVKDGESRPDVTQRPEASRCGGSTGAWRRAGRGLVAGWPRPPVSAEHCLQRGEAHLSEVCLQVLLERDLSRNNQGNNTPILMLIVSSALKKTSFPFASGDISDSAGAFRQDFGVGLSPDACALPRPGQTQSWLRSATLALLCPGSFPGAELRPPTPVAGRGPF